MCCLLKPKVSNWHVFHACACFEKILESRKWYEIEPPKFREYSMLGGHGWSRFVTVGHGRSRVSTVYFSICRFFQVTVGHGWSRSSLWQEHALTRHWQQTRVHVGYQNCLGLYTAHGSVQLKIVLDCALPMVLYNRMHACFICIAMRIKNFELKSFLANRMFLLKSFRKWTFFFV